MTTSDATLTGERADIAETLSKHRSLLRYTARGLTDEQAAARTTISELTIGGIIKHVTAVERQWAQFIVEGPTAMGDWQDQDAMQAWLDGFRMLAGDRSSDDFLESVRDPTGSPVEMKVSTMAVRISRSRVPILGSTGMQ